MTAHGLAVLIFTIAIFAAFTSRRIPIEVTSLFVLVALPIGFTLFPYEGADGRVDPLAFFRGFSHEALIAISSLMVLGRALVETGALRPVTRRLAALWRKRGSNVGLGVVLVAAVLVSGVVNDTPIVVLLIPVLVALARETGDSARRLLMPMNFAVLIGGMATTIGTSTNLLVVSIAARMQAADFGIFDFTPLVAGAALVALPWLWFVAPRLLPADADEAPAPVERLFDAVLEVGEDSELVGTPLGKLLERSRQDLQVAEVRRGDVQLVRLPNLKLAAGDRLVVRGAAARLKEFETRLDLKLYVDDDKDRQRGDGEKDALRDGGSENDLQRAGDGDASRKSRDEVLAEVIVLPNSWLNGATVREQRLSDRFGIAVLGAYRSTGRAMRRERDVADVRLDAGDVLLVQASPERLAALRAEHGLVVVDGEMDATTGGRGALASVIMAAVIVVAVTKTLPMYLAALSGVFALLVTRCVRPAAIGRALKTDIVLLIAASLALGSALLYTGAAAAIAQGFAQKVSSWPTIAVLGAMLVFMGVLTNVVSNNASAAIGTPIAIEVARSIGAPAEPFVLAILFGCNLSYATPIAYQTNLLVMSAARYRLVDFVRVGGPLLVLMALALTAMIGWRYSLWG
ncbi:MAG: SLC13 family permease [Burkholderiaceae bacterium]|nr:SLC13 family permease [Burkholderiaceae bacterium]